jgi:hypothetical protein
MSDLIVNFLFFVLDRVNHLHGSEMCFSHCSSRTDGYDLRSERHECGERIGECLKIED